MEDESGREVVLHFRDRTTCRGWLQREFSPSDNLIEVETEDGERLEVKLEGLKALFFIKDPRRRELEVQISSMEVFRPTPGAAARVEFFDGEVVHGRVVQYSVDENGFFLFPTNPESNNERIFVVVRALKTLYVETVTDGES
jgi:hypothetical protein